MATLDGRHKQMAIAVAIALVLAVGGWFALDANRQTSSAECIEDYERIQANNAELYDELGANAPTFDFHFPDSCFD